jgi:pyruvate dehydrogenase E2 component (dihydrolipoamide acetyltransferase)
MRYEFKLPDIGEGVHEGEIVAWLVQPGETVAEDQPLLEVMTDKVTAEIPSPVAGRVESTQGKVGEVIRVGAAVVVLETEIAETPSAAALPTLEASSVAAEPSAQKVAPGYGGSNGKTVSEPFPPVGGPAAAGASTKVLAAPATRRLARELGVSLDAVPGSGPHGRVTQQDIRLATSQPKPVAKPLAAATPTEPARAEDKRVPLSGLRRRIAEHLVHAKQTAPHFGYVDEVDMSEIVSIRKSLMPDAQAQGVSLSFLPFIVKAVVSGLKAYPMLNASLDDARQEIVYRADFNLGIAVSTEQGLVVPVVHHADRLSVKEIAQRIAELANKARQNKLTLDDLQGGTFTLTNIGSIGGLFGIPIINHPEVAILGVNKIVRRPIVNADDTMTVADMMYLSLSCDHRVVDGADAARFVNHVKAQLELPARLLWS